MSIKLKIIYVLQNSVEKPMMCNMQDFIDVHNITMQ